jgi:hypothetical protein
MAFVRPMLPALVLNLEVIMSNWISVEDRLPEDAIEKLTICFNDISEYAYPHTVEEAQSIAFYSNGEWWDSAWAEAVKEDNIIEDVTHWQLLPAPPQV